MLRWASNLMCTVYTSVCALTPFPIDSVSVTSCSLPAVYKRVLRDNEGPQAQEWVCFLSLLPYITSHIISVNIWTMCSFPCTHIYNTFNSNISRVTQEKEERLERRFEINPCDWISPTKLALVILLSYLFPVFWWEAGVIALHPSGFCFPCSTLPLEWSAKAKNVFEPLKLFHAKCKCSFLTPNICVIREKGEHLG